MRYAIDRFKIGSEEEVCADAFYGAYIPARQSRFFCPECGETVYWRSKGGSHPNQFYHKIKTERSPECDKRVDGRSGLYLYERVGLPVFITCSSYGQFYLNIGFPAVGEKVLERAESLHTKVCISSDNHQKVTYVNKVNFLDVSTTLLPIDFVPSYGRNYEISIGASTPAYELKKRWSDYADGFDYGGAFFTYEETGGKKIRRGDSVSPRRKYFVIAKQFRSLYSEINFNRVGSISLNKTEYSVYIVTINVSTNDEHKYSAVNNYLKSQFGIWLLETLPELITLWPPTVTRDTQTPIKATKKIYCAVSSGNDEPNVFMYNGSNTSRLRIDHDNDTSKSVIVPFYSAETVVSVDRKYVGRELFYQKKALPFHNFSYLLELEDNEGHIFGLDAFTRDELSTSCAIRANANMDVFIGSENQTYQRITIRDENTLLPSSRHPVEINVVIEKGVICTFVPNAIKNPFLIDETQYIDLLKKGHYGVKTPAPAWIRAVISKCRINGHSSLAGYLQSEIFDGKIYLGVLHILFNIKRELGN